MRSAPAVHRVCYPVTERWPVKWLEEEVGKPPLPASQSDENAENAENAENDEKRLSLTRTPARFPHFRRRRRLLAFATHTKGSDMVSVNSPPAFRNSKSGLRCATEEPMFKSVSLS